MRDQVFGKADAVIAGQADVFRDPQVLPVTFIEGTEGGYIIREHDACRRRGQGQQFAESLLTQVRIMVADLPEVSRVCGKPEGFGLGAEGLHTGAGNRCVFTMQESDPPVALGGDIGHEIMHALTVVRADAADAFRFIIQADNGTGAFPDIIHNAGDDVAGCNDQNTVTVPVIRMLCIPDAAPAEAVTQKEHVISQYLTAVQEAVEDLGEKLVRESLFGGFFKNDAEAVRTVCAKRFGGNIRPVAHGKGNLTDALLGLFAYVRRIMECLADGGQ